jgi:hypothetical protein
MTNEQKALKVAASKTQLRKRLNDAKSVLTDGVRERFKNPTFDFEGKRLISDDGKIALQWLTRPYPDQPEGYENQQTNRGCVIPRNMEQA